MKKYSSLIIIIVLLVAIFGGTYLLSLTAENKNFKEISYDNYAKLLKNNDEALVYFGSNKDTETLELLREISKENKVSVKYLFTEDLTEAQKKELKNNEKVLALVSNAKEENVYTGEFKRADILSYLKNNDLIAKEYISISADEYLELIKEKNTVVFIGSSTCGYCTKYKPEVNTVVNKYDVNIYYLELDKFSQEDLSKIYGSASFFTEEQWGTPTTFIFSNGKIVNTLSGYTTANEVANFLKINKAID